MKPYKIIQNMKFRVVATLIALSLIIVLPAKAITWGEADGDDHPNVGAMVVWPDGLGLFQICSGTLIGPNIFLTAGHCTDYLDYLIDSGQITTEEIYVNFNENALEASTLLDVQLVITHPDYNWGPYSNPHDVGILILEQPVGITPAILPYEGLLNDLRAAGLLRKGKEEADFTIVGYGGTLYWPPPEVTYDDQRQFALAEYQALLKSWLRLSQNKATGDGGSCYGDSGGPVFWTDRTDPENEVEILVGITSWGDIPCVATSFNYRVDTLDTLDFINEWLDVP